MTHLYALLGVALISFSAIFVRLAAVSPVTAAFFRMLDATPLLVAIWFLQRRGDGRTARERWLAFASGLVLAANLALWHESIALLGAGLGTVIGNSQVVFVAAAAWFLYGERLTATRVLMIATVLCGVALSSGLARPDAYGAHPVKGAVIGLGGGVLYAAFLVIYRVANRRPGPRSGPLLDSTVGAAVGALLCAPFDPHFTLAPDAAAHLWLAALAICSQVLGWLLIGIAIPRLPAVEMSMLLLGQPVLTMAWGVMMFDEHLSRLQWVGAAIVLAGVAATSLTSDFRRTT